MSTQPVIHDRVNLQQVVDVLKSLSPDKLESAYDYLLFLRSQYSVMSNDYGSVSDEELIVSAALTFGQLDSLEDADSSGAPHGG